MEGHGVHGNNLADDFDDFSHSKTSRAERCSIEDAVVDAGLSIGPFNEDFAVFISSSVLISAILRSE